MKYENNKKDVKKEETQVCKILEKINGKSAEEIINEYGNSHEYAIDIVEIVRKIGIKTFPMDFSELEKTDEVKAKAPKDNGRGSILGIVAATPDNLEIFYRDKASINEYRFTLAHEIGHCCLTMSPTEDFHLDFRMDNSNLNEEDDEYKVNVFAGQLLIPLQKLLDVYYDLNITSLKELAKKFVVSKSVMKERLKYLGMAYS